MTATIDNGASPRLIISIQRTGETADQRALIVKIEGTRCRQKRQRLDGEAAEVGSPRELQPVPELGACGVCPVGWIPVSTGEVSHLASRLLR